MHFLAASNLVIPCKEEMRRFASTHCSCRQSGRASEPSSCNMEAAEGLHSLNSVKIPHLLPLLCSWCECPYRPLTSMPTFFLAIESEIRSGINLMQIEIDTIKSEREIGKRKWQKAFRERNRPSRQGWRRRWQPRE